MTKKEIRELESWIAVNLFGWDLSRDGLSKSQLEHADEFSGFPPDSLKWRSCCCPHRVPDYTTDPAASDTLDDKILEWCAQNAKTLVIKKTSAGIVIRLEGGPPFWMVHHDDKRICRALFAKKLFTK